MKKALLTFTALNKITAVLTLCIAATILYSCEQSKTETATDTPKQKDKSELIDRGKYLVTIGGCNDCHSPKVMTPNGPVLDSARLLSGHPADGPAPVVDTKSLQPGHWILMAPDATAFAGPWGVSYTANLTSDSATGVGAWPEEVFIKTLRTGKHLGNGRQLLPPMPWQGVGKMTDEDLKSVLAYFKSLPPVNNRVPQPKAPNDVAKN